MLTGKLKNLYLIISDPVYRLESFTARGFYNNLSDEEFIRKKFKVKLGYDVNLDDPKSFNEKLQWLKLYDRRAIYTTMVDKYEAKAYAGGIIGPEYIVPNYGVWERFEDIDFSRLPEQFVLKCTHDSGGLVIVKDKSKLDYDAARKRINQSLKTNYFYIGREWPYKNVRPRIIAEKYLEDKSVFGVRDYKIHCFNGEPQIILVCQDRFSPNGMTEDFFNTEWNHLDISREKHPNAVSDIEKPLELELMIELARKLAKGIPFLRTDFYVINAQVYLGELTFFPGDGFSKFIPESYDYTIGDLLRLPKNKTT